MGKITIYEDKLIYQRRDELTILEPYGPNCIRCRSTKNSKILDEDWTLLPPKEGAEYSITGDESVAEITNGMVKVKLEAGNIWYGGIINFYRKDEHILHTKYEGHYTGRNVHREGDHYQVKVIFDAHEGEHFTGLDRSRRTSLTEKEARLILSIIIPSRLFRYIILRWDMDFCGIVRRREDARLLITTQCGFRTVHIRQIFLYMQQRRLRKCLEYMLTLPDMHRSSRIGLRGSGRAGCGTRLRMSL